MQLVQGKEQLYVEWKEKNSDPYSRACFDYAEKWAENIEAKMSEGHNLVDVAEQCEPNEMQITGFMYGMSVGILSETWVHGEQLRQWHNLKTQLGDEGVKANEKGTVLNPATLIVGK